MPIKDDNIQQMGSAGRKHPVPQNVMDVEFKVVGDITVRQLMYLFAGGIVVWMIWNAGLPAFWKWVLCIGAGSLAAGVSFVPIQERGMDKWLVSFLRAMTYNTQMVWLKSYEPPAYFLSDYAQIIKNEIITLTPAKSRSKLDEYLGQIPQELSSLDVTEFNRITKINESLFQPNSSNYNHTSVVTNSNIRPLYIPTVGSPSPRLNLSDNDNTQGGTMGWGNDPSQNQQTTTNMQTQSDQSSLNISTTTTVNSQSMQSITNTTTANQTKTSDTSSRDDKYKLRESPPEITLKETTEDELESKTELIDSLAGSKIEILNTTQIDRPIENYSEELKGEIKIKTTTKMPPTIVAQDIKSLKEMEQNLSDSVEELLEITRRAKSEYDEKQRSTQYTERLEFFKSKYQELSKEKEKITTQIDKNTSRVEMLDKSKQREPLEKQINSLAERNKELEGKLKELEKELFDIKTKTLAESETKATTNSVKNTDGTAQSKDNSSTNSHEGFHLPKFGIHFPGDGKQNEKNTLGSKSQPNTLQKQQTSYANTSQNKVGSITDTSETVLKPAKTIDALAGTQNGISDQEELYQREKMYEESSLNNVIYGTIKDKDGSLLDETIVLIKDKDGNVVRALKTNKLGQYKIQSPLPNGKYTIEAIKGGGEF